MDVAERQQLQRWLFWATVFGLIVLTLAMVRPFVVALLTAFILAYLVKPAVDYLSKYMPRPLAAVLCITLLILVVTVPISILITAIIRQAAGMLNDGTLSSLIQTLTAHPLFQQADTAALREKAVLSFIALFTDILSSLPHLLLSLVIIILGMYFMLTSWDALASKLRSYIPFKDKDITIAEIDRTTRTIVFGILIVAVLEFILASIGFSLAGVPAPLVFAALIFLFAFIPGLGPVVVWAPLALYSLLTQQYLAALILILTGIAMSMGLELFLMPRLVGKRARIHPFIMFLGVIGGVSLFGLFGFVIGPLLLVYTLKLLEAGLKKE